MERNMESNRINQYGRESVRNYGEKWGGNQQQKENGEKDEEDNNNHHWLQSCEMHSNNGCLSVYSKSTLQLRLQNKQWDNQGNNIARQTLRALNQDKKRDIDSLLHKPSW